MWFWSSFLISIQLFAGEFIHYNASSFTNYSALCELAARDDAVFSKFRRTAQMPVVVETVTYGHGAIFVELIDRLYPHFRSFFPKICESDKIGSPIAYDYPSVGTISPTTLRYIKIAGDILNLLKNVPDISKIRVVEIGGGYGGQRKIFNDLGVHFGTYTIIDIQDSLPLIARFLEANHVQNTRLLNPLQLEKQDYDLIISNYALSEFNHKEQLKYLNNVVNSCPMGYMMCNENGSDVLKTEEIVAFLSKPGRKLTCIPEYPQASPSEALLTWQPE